MKNDLIKLGIPEDKVKHLPNAVDTDVFSPLGKKEDNLLLFVGRIFYIKGLHVLLNSLEYLKTSVRLVIFEPLAWDSEYRNFFKRNKKSERQR